MHMLGHFGELLPSTLSGYVYEDTSAAGLNNGVKDRIERGIPGVVVALTGSDDFGAVARQTTTDATGLYRFEGLRPASTPSRKRSRPATSTAGPAWACKAAPRAPT